MKYWVSFIFVLNHLIVFGQMSKGDKLMDKKLYRQAVEAYEKEYKKDKPDAEVYQKIGFCYTKIKAYSKAEEAYRKASELKRLDPQKYVDYGLALINNNKIDEARISFLKYNEEVPDSLRENKYVQLCDSLLKWNKQKPEYELHTISGINTETDEFGAIKYNSQIIYTTHGKDDWVNYSSDHVTRNSYLDIFTAMQSSGNWSFNEGKKMAANLSSELHDGPANIDFKKNEFYFSRLIRTHNAEVMQLFVGKINNGEVTDIEPFYYNNNEYSIIHPCFSENGKLMFFASNKVNGGKGGYDIYYCKKLRKFGWSIPKLVPGKVNTEGNEVFPYYKNGTLYFSSDGHLGYGGLDIYAAFLDEHYKEIYNLKSPVNSHADDFGLTFFDDKNGYFTSNRVGGMGGDDIYGFTQLQKVKQDDLMSMTGIFEFNELPIAGAELSLMSEEGVEMARVRTDEQGRFEFMNLDPDKNYSIRPIDAIDGGDIYITNASGEKAMLLTSSSEFNYVTLKSQQLSGLPMIQVSDPEMISNPIQGYIYQSLRGDYSNRLEVIAYDDQGNIVATTFTDEKGEFNFEALGSLENYIIKLKESDVDLKMEIIGKSSFGQFNFAPLQAETAEGLVPIEVSDPTFITIPLGGYVFKTVKGDFTARIEIIAYDDWGEILARTYCDTKGNFKFANLPPQDVYMIKAISEDDEIQMMIYDFTNGTDILGEEESKNYFKYQRIDPTEEFIRLLNEEGVPIKIRENEVFSTSKIYYQYGSSDLSADAELELDKLVFMYSRNPHIVLHLGAHTDARGDEKYNLKLSEKRAKAVLKYLTKKGVPEERISTQGYGESKPLIPMSEIMAMSTEEQKEAAHAKNRRTDISITANVLAF